MKNTTKAGIAGAVVVLGLVACNTPDDKGATAPSNEAAASTSFPVKAYEPLKADPYSTDGTYLVGSEIAPGDYRATQRGSIVGYVEVCADAACKIGTDGFISNDLVDGSSVISIPANAKYVKLQRVTLAAL